MKLTSVVADEILDEREKSWQIKVGGTVAWIAKSQCEQVADTNEFLVPSWLAKKIVKAADEGLMKAA